MIEEVMDTHYEAINWGLGECILRPRRRNSADALRSEQTQTRAWQR